MIFHCSTQLTADIIIKPQHFIFSSGEGSLQCQYKFSMCKSMFKYETKDSHPKSEVLFQRMTNVSIPCQAHSRARDMSVMRS